MCTRGLQDDSSAGILLRFPLKAPSFRVLRDRGMGAFSKLFGKYLLVTNTVSSGLLMGAGDALQQRSDFMKKHMPKMSFEQATSRSVEAGNSTGRVANESSGYDYARTGNMVVVGLMQGPFSHYFYDLLERLLPGRGVATLLKKTLLDQSIASPACLGIFYVGLGTLERKNLSDIHEEIKLKWFDTWKVDCMFWPPVQFVNFLFVPLQYRVMYANFMEIAYDIFLSYVKMLTKNRLKIDRLIEQLTNMDIKIARCSTMSYLASDNQSPNVHILKNFIS